MKFTGSAVVDVVWARKGLFLVAFFGLFTVTYSFLYLVDFLPEAPDAVDEAATEVEVLADNLEIADTALEREPPESEAPAKETASVSTGFEQPVSIYFSALDKTIAVAQPESNSIAALDTALLRGAVRHPDSALLGQDGTVFVLGHSSYLPHVRNHNFQAFNGIQNLQWGDEIVVTGESNVYTYRVSKVYEARASELVVPISGNDERLVLATCDSFGSVDDRFIVEADLVERGG